VAVKVVGRTGVASGGTGGTVPPSRIALRCSALDRSILRNKGRRTFELFVELTPRGDGEGTDKLFEIDCAVAVVVKDVEDIVCELARIAKGEELLVDTAEFFLVECATWTVS
jgi:hypothetical protein